MQKLGLFFTLLVGLFSGCATVTEHPPIELPEVSYSFTDFGCTEESYYWDCSESDEELLKACDFIMPSVNLGGLTPEVAMVECQMDNREYDFSEAAERIRDDGCMMPVYIHYIAYDGKKLHYFQSFQEMATFFAPIDTPEEALSYAIALSGNTARYELDLSSYRTFVTEVEATHVDEVEGGYEVRLFSYDVCGCGPHGHFSVDYFVSTEGEVENLGAERIYEDPEEDGLCVD